MEGDNFFRILSAEDDPDDRFLIKEAIHAAGIDAKIDFVEDGETLLTNLLGKNRPDIVLLDLNFPKMDGRQALKAIKNQSKMRNIPIVVLTTSEAQQDINACSRMGVTSFVTKPKSFPQLVDIMKRLSVYSKQTSESPSKHD